MQQAIRKILVGFLLTISVTVHAGLPSKSLLQAHQAFLENDDKGMLNSVVEAFKDQSLLQVEKENIRDLITKSFELKHGKLNSDVKLVHNLNNISIVTRYANNKNRINTVIEIKGNTSKAGLIKTIEFSKYPNKEILNKANNQFEWNEEGTSFYLKDKNAEVLEDGLYHLVVVMQDGEILDTWLPLIDMSMNTSPKILSPSDEETTLNHNPEIHWQLVPPLKPLAYNTLIAVEAALSNPPDYKWSMQWGLYFTDLTQTSAIIGRNKNATGVLKLPTGRHQIIVSQNANRYYGPIRVSTQTSEKITLHVR